MRLSRTLWICIGALALLLASVAATAAGWGYFQWGDARWYFRWDSDFRFAVGEQAVSDGLIDRAEEIAVLLEADGRRNQACLLRGMAFFQMAQPAVYSDDIPTASQLLGQAVTELNKIREKDDSVLVPAALLQGKCFMHLRQPFEAEHSFKYVLSKEPDNIDAHRGLGVLYYDQGLSSRAILHMTKVCELAPDDGRPYCLMGQIYRDGDLLDEAIQSFREAIKRDLPGKIRAQNPAVIRKELAECLVLRGRHAEALAVLDEITEVPAQDLPAVLALRADCLLETGKQEEAREVLDEALEDNQDQVELFRVKAKIHIRSGEFQAAVDMLRKGLRIDRHSIPSRMLLINAYHQLKDQNAEQENRALLDETQKLVEELARLNRLVMNDTVGDRTLRHRLAELCDKLDKPALAEMWRRNAASMPALPERPASKSSPPDSKSK